MTHYVYRKFYLQTTVWFANKRFNIKINIYWAEAKCKECWAKSYKQRLTWCPNPANSYFKKKTKADLML